MPNVPSSRVKNTGHGQIEYASSNAGVSSGSQSTSTTSSGSGVDTVGGLNIGGGVGIYAGAVGSQEVTLEFRTLIAGTGIEFTQDSSSITITATGNAVANGGTNTGNAISNGFVLALGNAATYNGGAWTNGAVTLNDAVPVSLAIELINNMLGLLVPTAPPAFPNGTLSITNAGGSIPFLAVGVTDNANSGLSAGSAVTRITGEHITTNSFANVGPANTGRIQMLINNAVVSQHSLSNGNDNGNYSGLIISNEIDYPANQPGFYKAMTIGVTSAVVPQGVNKIRLNHTAAGSTNEITFVDDTLTVTPTLLAGSITPVSNGTLVFSSSVPHYGTGGTLTANATINNIAGQTYYGGLDPFTVTGTNSIIGAQTFAYANVGISTPIPQNTVGSTTLTPVTVNINGSTHGYGFVQAFAKNVNGAAAAVNISNTAILVKNGSVPAGKFDELNVSVSNHGILPNGNAAIRVAGFSAGDTPSGSASAWNPSASLGNTDAAVVAGVLSNNQTNYSTGFLPVGPDLSSGRNNAQYITLSFNRSSISQFVINVTGTYAGVWVKLPGVSDNSLIAPNAVNGWWNAGLPYAGAGVPGNASDTSAGCAVGTPMTGSSGAYTITFGPQSSTNANGNTILVHIRLNAGQSISSLSFS